MVRLTLFQLIERLASKGWRGILENPRCMVGLFTKVLLCIFGHLSKGHCLAVYSMSREIYRLYRKCGPLFVGQYLKQVQILLMWYVGGELETRPACKTAVSLTRSGIPRFIPPMYRKIIRRDRSAKEVKVVLSICALSRLLKVPPVGGMRVNPQTIHQVGFQLSASAKEICSKLVSSGFSMLAAYVPAYRQIPLRLGFAFKPNFSSGPNTYKDPYKESSVVLEGKQDRQREREGRKPTLPQTLYHSLPVDASALITLFQPEVLAFIGSIWFASRDIMVDNGYDAPVVPDPQGKFGFGQFIERLLSPARHLWWEKMITRPEAGRFGRKLEGSGKIRLFAIANPIFQSLLRPLHDWVMSVLSHLVTDGTFDQLAPLARLQGKMDLYSFDLKAATDLLPVDLSGSLLVSLFGDDLPKSWVMMMTMVGFRSPDRLPSRLKARVYRFTRGQPLGYYSSWPVFALTHHVLVWLAAYEVYPGKRFYDYALLGDDIVIADKAVALAYQRVMSDAMAVISLEKSLISSTGACEFAKRFYMNYHRKDWVDLSPISLACVRLCRGFVSSFVFKQLGVNVLNSFRLRGGGYRVFSKVRIGGENKIFPLLSKRWKRHWLTLYAGSGICPLPFQLWLAFPDMGILNCYQVGMVRDRLLESVKPRDLDESSFSELYRFWEPDGGEVIETLLHPVVKGHLDYLLWYIRQVENLSELSEDLLHPPVSPRRIRRESTLSSYQRYGIRYRLWDFVRSREPPGPLPSHNRAEFKDNVYTCVFKFRDSVGMINGEPVFFL